MIYSPSALSDLLINNYCISQQKMYNIFKTWHEYLVVIELDFR